MRNLSRKTVGSGGLLAAAMALAVTLGGGAAAAAPPPHLDPPSPTVAVRPLAGARLFDLYWDSDWSRDAGGAHLNPDAIDGFVNQLANSHYFDALAQYGVGRPRLIGSATAAATCGPTAPRAVDPASVSGFVACEAAVLGLPASGDQLVVNVILPAATRVDLPGPAACLGSRGESPKGLMNYHGDTANHGPGPAIAFTVIASGCAEADGGGVPFGTPFAHLTWAASHEMVEALTDPLPAEDWIDRAIGSEGEAADICQPPVEPVRFDGGMVTPYWSNRAGSCVAWGHRESPNAAIVDRAAAGPDFDRRSNAAARSAGGGASNTIGSPEAGWANASR